MRMDTGGEAGAGELEAITLTQLTRSTHTQLDACITHRRRFVVTRLGQGIALLCPPVEGLEVTRTATATELTRHTRAVVMASRQGAVIGITRQAGMAVGDHRRAVLAILAPLTPGNLKMVMQTLKTV